jgi:carboxyl-terminal processing protease
MNGSTVRKGLLIIALELALFGPALLGVPKIDRGVVSTHNYWAQTGLSDQELLKLLKNENCYSSSELFLACVNSISSMAERYRLVLNLEGHLVEASSQEIKLRLTEKSELELWRAQFDHKKEISLPVSFIQLWQLLDKKYIQAEERSAVIGLGINGFLSVFKDPHTYLIPLKMYEEVIANSEAKNTGLGILSRREPDHIFVRKVFEGSSAADAGLLRGDRILEINKKPIQTMTPLEVSESLRMKDIFKIHLLVLRNGETFRTTAQRKEALSSKSVAGKMIDASVGAGLITIHKFAKNTCQQTRDQIIALKEQNLRGLVLDLRDNPGGQVEEASCVLGLFVEPGTFLFETRYKDPAQPADRYVAEGELLFKGSLAVLINSGSASAAEIVAGVLKDLGRATLVGERSFGKGSFQDGRIWGANKNLVLFETAGLYYFPSGWTPQLVGLEPDLPVQVDTHASLREEDLYLNPIRPLDIWTGPQSLAWFYERKCDAISDNWSALLTVGQDQQLERATQWLSCGGGRNDRNGSL